MHQREIGSSIKDLLALPYEVGDAHSQYSTSGNLSASFSNRDRRLGVYQDPERLKCVELQEF
jgi:hypothetical protein